MIGRVTSAYTAPPSITFLSITFISNDKTIPFNSSAFLPGRNALEQLASELQQVRTICLELFIIFQPGMSVGVERPDNSWKSNNKES